MSIASEITRINGNISAAYTAADAKGATLPATQNSANLATCINSISGGSSPTINSLSITPSTSAQTITASSGIDGYSPINVSAVTSSIDQNISAGNIKDGVTILGVTGNYTGGGTAPIGYLPKTAINGELKAPTTSFTYTLPVGVTTIGEGVLYNAFNDSGLTSIDLSNITTINGNNAMNRAFYNGSGLTSIDLSSLTSITGDYACTYCFFGCSGLTSIDLSSLITVSGLNCCSSFLRSTTSKEHHLTSISFPALTTISGENAFSYLVFAQTSLTSISFPVLTTISGGYCFSNAFKNCTNLTSISFPALTTISSSSIFIFAFQNCTSLASISFPSLKSDSFGEEVTQFNSMLSGVTGCTVHFPSNLQSVIGSWSSVTYGFSGTNTTVLFDLTATE